LHLVVQLDLITLVISDDGVGFNLAEDFPGRLGLQGMRDRALEVGGELEISSATGTGTPSPFAQPRPLSSIAHRAKARLLARVVPPKVQNRVT